MGRNPVVSRGSTGESRTLARGEELGAIDAPYPRVVPIALQQSGAERKEIGMGNAVVLEEDTLL